MHPYFRLHLSSVLGFLAPPEGSSPNWDEAMIVGLFRHLPSDLTTGTGCCHHTKNRVRVITGSCDLLSFGIIENLCHLVMLVAEVQSIYYGCCSYAHPHPHLHPSCEKVVPSSTLKKMSWRKENWRIVPEIRCLDTSAKKYNSISSLLAAELHSNSHWNVFGIRWAK